MNGRYEVQLDLKNKLVKKLEYYASIKADLNNVKKVLAHIHKVKESEITNALFGYSIITYGRAFVSGDRTKLTEDDLKSKDPSETGFHRQLMDMRHQFIAHAGNNQYEEIKVFLMIDPTRTQILNDFYEKIQQFSFSQREVGIFQSLVDRLLSELNRRSERVAKRYIASLEPKEKRALLRKAKPYMKMGTLYSSNYKIPKKK